MPYALRTATPMGDWRSFKFTVETPGVYGIKEEENVTEDLPLEPLTDYSKYKAPVKIIC